MVLRALLGLGDHDEMLVTFMLTLMLRDSGFAFPDPSIERSG